MGVEGHLSHTVTVNAALYIDNKGFRSKLNVNPLPAERGSRGVKSIAKPETYDVITSHGSGEAG